MSVKQLKLTYALKDGEIVSIEDVKSGLTCGCICPACGDPLVAKKGEKMMHHFAHHAGHTCEFGYESSLHLAAKNILSKAKKIVIPAVYLSFPNSYKEAQLISESKEIKIDKVELEKRYSDIVPDIVIYSGGKQLFVEIYVTHRIDDEKLNKLRKENISTIEIDLSDKRETISTEELTNLLLNNSEEKKWIYNAISNKYLQKFYNVADKRNMVFRGLAVHIDYCPIKMRIWRGKAYANFFDDCLSCDYCIFVEENISIFCTGRRRISTINDFCISEEKRIKDSESILSDIRESAVFSGYCPYCGGDLRKRHGPYGDFFGCSNYPHCEFKVGCDPDTGVPKY